MGLMDKFLGYMKLGDDEDDAVFPAANELTAPIDITIEAASAAAVIFFKIPFFIM